MVRTLAWIGGTPPGHLLSTLLAIFFRICLSPDLTSRQDRFAVALVVGIFCHNYIVPHTDLYSVFVRNGNLLGLPYRIV